MEVRYYALATIEGLHLTCDFVVHSAAIFGCPPLFADAGRIALFMLGAL